MGTGRTDNDRDNYGITNKASCISRSGREWLDTEWVGVYWDNSNVCTALTACGYQLDGSFRSPSSEQDGTANTDNVCAGCSPGVCKNCGDDQCSTAQECAASFGQCFFGPAANNDRITSTIDELITDKASCMYYSGRSWLDAEWVGTWGANTGGVDCQECMVSGAATATCNPIDGSDPVALTCNDGYYLVSFFLFFYVFN
jgi:hypothetical protein